MGGGIWVCGGGFSECGRIGMVGVAVELERLLFGKNWRIDDERRIARALFGFVLED